MNQELSNIKAILGPTNTGKTHYAMEKLMSYKDGMMGFPLRLLARENYDRAVQKLGPAHVALITGEEKIVPAGARYYFCTVESMPVTIPVECVIIDEIQLCADPDRGHIFTDRLLHARGSEETLFIGSDAMQPILAKLFDDIEFISMERLSELTYTGFKKITRLPPRTAIVAFSIDDVYSIAELIRRQRGGTAIVLGALSPRTRNAQVEMYQKGEVDYLVATDAIGMGLNLDIQHVAFARLHKFDGKKSRPLTSLEIGQIAGRAGRYKTNGTFGVTGNTEDIPPEQVSAIQEHHFEPIDRLMWRNSKLNFKSLKFLAQSLEQSPDNELFVKGRPATDYLSLKKLMGDGDIMKHVTTKDLIMLLWECCMIPDFRQIMNDSHVNFIKTVFTHLKSDLNDGKGRLPEDWVLQSIARLDRTDGDIDTLMNRIAHIRTWTYISHRDRWHQNPTLIQEKASSIEDKLSDALHERLAARFVNKESSMLLKRLGAKGDFDATITKTGEIIVGTYPIGVVKDFGFETYAVTYEEDKNLLLKAARPILSNYFDGVINDIIKADDDALHLNEDGYIEWKTPHGNTQNIAKIIKGESLVTPTITVYEREYLNMGQIDVLTKFLQSWLGRLIHRHIGFITDLQHKQKSGALAGILFQIFENHGWIKRYKVKELLDALTPEDRKLLKSYGIFIGAFSLHHKQILSHHHHMFMMILWNCFYESANQKLNHSGQVTIPINTENDADFAAMIGYYPARKKAIRLDILERLNKMIYEAADKGKFTLTPAMLNMIALSYDDADHLLKSIGFKCVSKDDHIYHLPSLKHHKANKVHSKSLKKSSDKAPKKKQEKEINPDSPFAILKQLQK